MPGSRRRLRATGFLLVAFAGADCGSDGDRRARALAIAGGTFEMGTARAKVPALMARYGVEDAARFATEVPAHPVTLSPFRMDATEVTNGDFARFVDANHEWAKERLPDADHNGRYLDHWLDDRPPDSKVDHPVVFVTWNAAQAFCRWADGRLPTEAEWEYAARAGTDSEFPWGDELPSPARANYGAAGLGDTSSAGRFPPNAFGLYDLPGNVWEFLLDEWRSSYPTGARVDPVAGGPVPDDAVRAVTGRRAVRGASFEGSVLNLRTRSRDSHVASNAVAFVGFRCAYPE